MPGGSAGTGPDKAGQRGKTRLNVSGKEKNSEARPTFPADMRYVAQSSSLDSL